MKVEIEKSFLKEVSKLNNSQLKAKVKEIILSIEETNSIATIKNIKKLKGFKYYYRIKIGDYRLGFELKEENNLVRLISIAHRKDIYKIFP